MPEEILVGSRVRHIGCELSPARGEGEVIGQWGNWYFCRNCYLKIKPACISIPSRFGSAWPDTKEIIDTTCPECGKENYPISITGGEDIFDVRFGDKEHSCHKRLLQVI